MNRFIRTSNASPWKGKALAAAMLALAAAAPAVAAEQSVSLEVRMACPICEYNVTRILSSVPGVRQVKVSLPDQLAVVTYDDAVTGASDIAAATQEFGYETRILDPLEARVRGFEMSRSDVSRQSRGQSTIGEFLRQLWSKPVPELGARE